jgi:hypothetical protein
MEAYVNRKKGVHKTRLIVRQARNIALTVRVYARRAEPDRITAPVNRQMAVSELLLSSVSSVPPGSSRPRTRLTIPYSSTKDFGSRIKHFVGTTEKR